MSEFDLSHLTSLRVGGQPARLVDAQTEDELIAAVSECDADGEPVLLLGGGSNVVIADSGFPGTVIRVGLRGVESVEDQQDIIVTAAAGESWDHLVAQAVCDGWTGIETLSGIPGLVGATPIQNVGAYGREVAEVIVHVDTYDRVAGERVRLTAAECEFEYRSSIFKRTPGRWVILSVTFRLRSTGESDPIRYADLAARLGIQQGETDLPIRVRRAVLDVRRTKGMVLDIDDYDTWSVGSFFTNPIVAEDAAKELPDEAPRWPMPDGMVKLSAAWLISQAGFDKGWPGEDSRARLSTKHTLAVTNRGHASCDDVLDVARRVRSGVLAATGIDLHAEPNLIGCEL